MPIALLLQDHLGVLVAGVRRMLPAGPVFERAALVLQRRQGAFLLHWFGPGLRFDGVDLRVAVVNAGAIQARVARVRALQAEAERAEGGPNLVEPLAGLTGVLTGALLGVVFGVAVLAGTVLGGVVGVVVAVLAALAGAAGAWFGFVGPGLGLYRGYKGLMGAVGASSSDALTFVARGRQGAAWAEALVRLGDQALGPRDQVANPVLRAALVLADRLTALTAQAVGAAATFLQLLPVLRVLERAKAPFLGLVAAGRIVIEEAVRGIVDAVLGVVESKAVKALPGLLKRAVTVAVRGVLGLVTAGIAQVRRPFQGLARELPAAWDRTGKPVVDRNVKGHPTVVFLRSISALGGALGRLGTEIAGLFPLIGRNLLPRSVEVVAGAAAAALRRLSGPPSGGPGMGARLAAWARSKLSSGSGPSLPTPPALQSTAIPGIGRVIGREVAALPAPSVPALAPRAFTGERERLAAALEAAAADPTYRAATMVLDAAARLAGDPIDAEVAKLRGQLTDLERKVRGDRPPLPVRDLPPPRRLVPVLGTVRVRATDRPRPEVSAWADDVVRRLGATPYAVPARAPAPAAAGGR